MRGDPKAMQSGVKARRPDTIRKQPVPFKNGTGCLFQASGTRVWRRYWVGLIPMVFWNVWAK